MIIVNLCALAAWPVFYGLLPLPEDLIQLFLGQVVTEDA